MSLPYTFHPDFVVRSPRFPLHTGMTESQIEALLHNEPFLESVYLASPVLYNESLKYRAGQLTDSKEIRKLKRSLIKYYLRAANRCTPFGLFSGCGTGKWSADAKNVVLNSRVERHTRFDMHYLCALAQHLATLPGIKENLVYHTNNSQYTIGDEIRYVEYKYLSGTRIHQISSVNTTDYLEQLLKAAANGISLPELEEMLAAPGISSDDIAQFIDELLASQLLVSELEPAITGDEFIHQVLSVLKRIYQATANDGVLEIIEVLEVANARLQAIDAATVNSAEAYREITRLLDRLGVAYDEAKLFQTDMIRKPLSGGLPQAMQAQLLDAVRVLNRFGTYSPTNTNLQSFIKRFHDRYEEKEMPLLEVLDTETGIGYLEGGAQEHVPLVEDIVFSHTPNPTQQYPWSPVEKYLMRKVSESYHTGNQVMEITEEEMVFLNNQRADDLPPSMHLMFRVIDPARNLLYIETCGGSSVASLLGRFAHADAGIRQMVGEVVAQEEALNPDVVFAEIIHLPESRVGNVLLHPSFRKHEIAYLAKSAVDKAFQVQVQDLMIAVRKEQIVLRCKRTGRYIIPRLSSAHNYRQNALPVYQFLCDLQLQQQRGSLGFNWGTITYLVKSLPRIQYKNTILSPATWRLIRPDFSDLLEAQNPAAQQERLNAFVQKWHLPRLVVLVDGDNELLIDFDNATMVEIFLETIRKRSGFELREFLHPAGNTFADEQGQVYNNQVVAALIKQEPTYRIPQAPRLADTRRQERTFMTGSEWLYYKIYCGAKSADKILVDAIKPVTEYLLEQKIISEFFFIRYNDPMFHIRFRIRFSDVSRIGEAIQLIYQYLQPFHQSGHLWKLQSDTYNRETERYGTATIHLAESLFHYDSVSVLQMLNETWGDAREHVRWLWAMRAVGDLLDAFGLDTAAKIALTGSLKESFAKEFNADKFLKEQLNAKFRNHRAGVETIMNPQKDGSGSLQPLLNLLAEKRRAMAPVVAELLETFRRGEAEQTLPELLSSYIHMLVNRVIASKPRLHEMVIYDMLHRHYKSVAAQGRQREKNTSLPESTSHH